MVQNLQTKPKIAVIRGGALGDVIMTTPIIRELYNRYNGFVEIYVQTGFPDVFKNNPYIAGVNPIKPQHYDAIYNLMLSYENNPKVHAVKAYGVSAFGLTELSDYSLEIFPSNADIEKIQDLNLSNYIVIHMRHHTWPSRNLGPVFYQSLVEKILATTNLNIIQVGGAHEIAFSDSAGRLINMLDKFSIHEVKCLIDNAKAFIGMDGGLIHVAACSDTPLIAFFTSCRSEYREPLKATPKFYPIAAKIDCYGCQENNISCTEFVCHKRTSDCVNTFNADEIVHTLISAIDGEKVE